MRERVGADGRDCDALVVALLNELRDLARPDRGMDTRERERGREVDPAHGRGGVGRAQDGRVEHPAQTEIGGERGLAAGALEAVDAHGGSTDDLPRAFGPLLERVLVDDEPHLLVAAFDFFLGADQSRHVRMASSIFGYAPQRQRLPAIA